MIATMYSIAILSTLLSAWLMFADTLPDFRFDFLVILLTSAKL